MNSRSLANISTVRFHSVRMPFLEIGTWLTLSNKLKNCYLAHFWKSTDTVGVSEGVETKKRPAQFWTQHWNNYYWHIHVSCSRLLTKFDKHRTWNEAKGRTVISVSLTLRVNYSSVLYGCCMCCMEKHYWSRSSLSRGPWWNHICKRRGPRQYILN